MSSIPVHWRGHWFVVGFSRSVKSQPVAFKFAGLPLVLARFDSGLRCFLDYCPHRGFPLSQGVMANQKLRCAYHGWEFGGDGHCVRIPSSPHSEPRGALQQISVVEMQGMIFISWKPKDSPYVSFLQNDAGYSHRMWSDHFAAPLELCVENFLDPTHTPYIHPYLIRNPNQAQSFTASVTRDRHKIEVAYLEEGKQRGFISRLFEKNRTKSSARLFLPAVAEIDYETSTEISLRITCYFTPQDANNTQVFTMLQFPNTWKLGWFKYACVFPFFRLAVAQDKKAVETQSRNLKNFASKEFMHSPTDVLHPWSRQLLRTGETEAGQIEIPLFL